MSTPLLTTKITVPPVRPRLVPRPHLEARLESGLSGKLTLVSAPAGFGKTTLVSQWAANTERALAWLVLDKNDNDPGRFLAYLGAALGTIPHDQGGAGGLGARLAPQLHSAAAPETEALLIELLNDIGAYPGLILLCLDDYHTIQDVVIHRALAFFVDYLPENAHLVLMTRADPPLPLARWRGRGQVNELRAADLRFSVAETGAFYDRILGIQLAAGDRERLNRYTEGWITGLQLAGLSMRTLDPGSISGFIANFSGRDHLVLDYLMDEVLSRQPAETQRFLLQTSILERMNGELCTAVLGDGHDFQASETQAILDRLYHANMFLVPMDPEHTWYRYHQLFAELLRARLRDARPDLAAELQRRAAVWYERHGLMPEAVAHALATGDHTLAADMIQEAVRKVATWSRADVATLQRWLQAIPGDALRDRPWLRLYSARALCTTDQWETGKRILDDLERSLPTGLDSLEASELQLQILADQASIAAVQGEVNRAIEKAEYIRPQLPVKAVGMRIRVAALLGMAYFRAGQVQQAGSYFTEAIEIAHQAGMAFAAVPLYCNLAEVQIGEGHLEQAWQTCRQALELGTINGKPAALTGFAGLGLGKVAYERGQPKQAEQYILDGLERLVEGGHVDSFGAMHAELAQVRQTLGDQEGARQAIRRASQIAAASAIPRVIGRIAAYQARLWLVQGELQLASQWAHSYRQQPAAEYEREFEDLTVARILLAEKQPEAAGALLDELCLAAQTAGRVGSVVHIQVLRALALDIAGDAAASQAALEQALHLARPEGYRQIFLEGGRQIRRMLLQMRPTTAEPGYLDQIRAAFAPRDAQPTRQFEQSGLVEPLTDRELDLLPLLARGLTNAEIGQRLSISLPTVKTHTRNIYAKLGVHNRKHAVSQARQLGLLPAD